MIMRGTVDTEFDLFLSDLWGRLRGAAIEDRTGVTPKDRRKGTRDIAKVDALVLHQMAFSRGNDATRYDTVVAHFAILPDGKTLRLHPETALLWASNHFNARSVAVEFAGNFPDTKGRCWNSKEFGCHRVTPEQIEAGRRLVRHLVDTIGLTHVLAHRQSSGSRENDPGPDLWAGVGQWAVDQLGLGDGGPGFKVGDGNPIPSEWRTWAAPSRESELAYGPRPPGGSYVPSGTEAAMVRAAIRSGERNENALADLVFFRRHPERRGRLISRDEPGFAALSQEWLRIRDTLVRPELQGRPARPAPGTGGGGSPGAVDVVQVRGITVARQIAPQVERLLAAAEADGVRLSGGGFRTREEQIEHRRNHCGTTPYDIYEKPSSQCSPMTAIPGTSNHERGLAIDFRYNGASIGSRDNAGFRWLAANAGRFGLINLPKEPWHWSVDGR